MTKIRAYKDNILCTDADFGDQTTEAGIILKSTLGKVSLLREKTESNPITIINIVSRFTTTELSTK